ncbi:hypothetical protein F2P81_019178 [Scophthalmus maximus]|uniref:BHLH domain-containing protein n=1 Tax=Scophthalmus maximus TaxID=52904 RepID=A0A6A4SAG8_SCOMX|nr:hypothetical protein F2P81_019178 [Scophthalmus maximus]
MTETPTPGRKPKKKKNKESHNAVERHRKEKINAGINLIGDLLPCSQALKQSKNMILDQAFRYITELKKQNDTLLLDGGDKVQAEEIRRLRRQVEELRKESAHYIELLKAHDINILEDPTIHWKGKQRCAKVAKVTPTHQLPKGIIVYSNGNVTCPAGMENSPGKQPSETLILQPPSEIGGRLRVNGALLQVNTSSSTPALLPGSTVTPPQSAPGLRVGEQCVVETPVAAPNLPPSVSYITLQIPTATTALPKQPQAAGSAHTFTLAATSAQQLATESSASPVSTLPTLTQTVTRATASELCSWVTQDTAIRTISYSAVPNSQAILRTGAAGSTQTTWTTLQIAGNTVQPVCQNLSTPEVSNTAQAVQQVTLCPVSNKQSVQPIQIQMQSNVPVQQAPITAHIQAQPFQRPSQLQPAILNQAQPPPVLAPQPQCAVIPQSAIVPQPAVVAHPAVASQPQPTVLQPGSLIPNPATALIPQPQPALVPLLQTMQVLQVNPNGATASGATAPQNTNNPSVVILQQASSCPTQSVVREEITNQTPCQHIVIIQAPNQAAPGPQNPQVGLLPAAVPSAVPVVSTQMSTTSSSTSAASIQSVGGKQLVHILPRPVQPQMNQPLQVTQSSSSPPVPPTPQTITVNGQVFALQPMKTSDKTSSQGGHSTLQLVQPTTTEEPTTNVALNSLGALSSLNQSISQGLPLTISSQNSGQPPAAQLSVVQQQQPLQPPAPVPVSGTTLALPVQQLQVPCLTPVASGLVVNAPKPSRKRVRTNLNMKRAAAKRAKPVKKKELSQLQPAVVVPAKPAVSTGEGPKVQVTVSQGLLSSEGTHTCTTAATTTDNNQAVGNVTSTQNAKKTIVSSSSSETITLSQSHSQSKSLVSACQSNAVFSLNDTGAMATTLTTVNSASVKPPSVSAAVVIQSKPAVISGNNSTVTKVSAPEVKQPTSSTATSTTQTKSAATTAVSRQSRTVVSSAGATDTGYTSITVCTACLTPVCTGSVTTTSPVSLNQVTQPTSVCPPPSSNAKPPAPCNKPQSQPTTSSSVSIPVTLSLSAPTYPEAHSSVTAPPASSEFRKRVGASRAPSQQSDVNMSNPSPCHPTEVKAPQAPRRDRETQEEKHSTAAEKESLVAATSDALSRKDFALSQQVYTNLDDQTLEHPMTSGRQTDSPMSSGAGGGRGFSVASMLPQGHNISAASGSFGTFTFTSEQAEMLALAMLEQESPGRRSGGCTGDSTASSNPTTGSWEPPKTPPVSTSKERGPTVQQAKVTKPMDTVTVKPAVQVSVRRQVGEGSVNGHNGSRHPQNISYSQSQSHAQVQPQSSSQSGTVASLSVNNLIRPSSSQKPYPGSPSLTGQLGSVPSPVGTSAHISQASNNALSPCSGAAQLNEYTPLKTALMRAQAGAGVAERHVKIISKRQAQDAVMLNTGKRPKPCPPSAPIVTHMDMKAPDHSQMMPGQDHNAMQRMMSSRTLEQQLISPPSNPVSRSSELACAPSRQERHRVSSYSAEALIGKSSTSGEQQQRMGLHLQPGHGGTQEQPELCGYLDTSRGKANIAHNPQNRLPSDHPGSADVQRVSECPPFKAMGGGGHQLGGFEVQVSRGSDMAPKSVPPSQRGPQGQQQGGFRMNVGPLADSRNRGGYSGAHPGTQGVQVGPPLPREQDGCHQSFMQSLLSPHLPEHSNHQRAVQCCPPVSMEYSCVPGSSSGDIQAKASSPSVPQKASTMRLGEGNKGHLSQVSSNMHGGPGVRAGLPHPPTPHSSSEGGRSSAPSRPPTAISQHSRHITRDTQPAKLRPGDRPRSGALRPSNPFEPDGHLSLPSGGGVLLSRPQAGGEARRSTIVRFMADSGQVPSENNLVPDQHITQNFGFPFIPEGGMNPPPINANSTFIPPVSQSNASRTPSLLPVEPQNTLPSFYPSYSPAAHPSLPSDVTLQYFPNQMFTSPSADKGSAPPLNNRFGSILSPPRPVGFGQASFSLLPDMPPMPIANSSGITPHISNFSLTSLFPEIATGMPTDGSAMPMSPLLSLSNTSSADSGKQPNRPAHNISHILGHDGSSAV